MGLLCALKKAVYVTNVELWHLVHAMYVLAVIKAVMSLFMYNMSSGGIKSIEGSYKTE